MKKIFTIILLLISNQINAQSMIIDSVKSEVKIQIKDDFPDKIKGYNKKSNQTHLSYVFLNKQKMRNLSLDQLTLVEDADNLSQKVVKYFDSQNQDSNKKNNNSLSISSKNKDIKPLKYNSGYLLITKMFFVGKERPYNIEKFTQDEEIEHFAKEVIQNADCSDKICVTNIITGINYYDANYQLKEFDVKEFIKKISIPDNKTVKGVYSFAEEGMLKVYYFYSIGEIDFPKNKEIIKKMIIDSKKDRH